MLDPVVGLAGCRSKGQEMCSADFFIVARNSKLHTVLDCTSESYFQGTGKLSVAPELPVGDPWSRTTDVNLTLKEVREPLSLPCVQLFTLHKT